PPASLQKGSISSGGRNWLPHCSRDHSWNSRNAAEGQQHRERRDSDPGVSSGYRSQTVLFSRRADAGSARGYQQFSSGRAKVNVSVPSEARNPYSSKKSRARIFSQKNPR